MTLADEPAIIGPDSIRYSFADEIAREPGGQHLFTCSPCGTCTGTCPVRLFNPSFNPRRLLLKATLGLRDEVLSSPEIWQCSACDVCYSRCPHQVRVSDVMKAIRSIALREGYRRPGPTAAVRVETCAACGRCAAVCPYGAIQIAEVMMGRQAKQAARVDANACAGCGICSAACPSSSIQVDGQTDRDLHEHLMARTASEPDLACRALRGKVVALVCRWCLHNRPDIAAAAHPPEGVEVIRVECTGRVSESLVLTALHRGADAVLTVGCKREECHYLRGSNMGGTRLEMLAGFLEVLGIDRDRVRFSRMGSLDRQGFARLLAEVAHDCEVGAEAVTR